MKLMMFLFFMNMKHIVCKQMAYFRQELVMILGWEILLGLSKTSDAGEKVLKLFK